MADAEDAMNTAMLRAFQHFSSQTGEITNQKAWLRRVLHNVCMDFHRERRRFVEPLEAPSEPDVLGQLPLEGLPPDEVLLECERAEEIRAHIQALPPNLRTPLVMRFLHDMSYAEIATHLQLTNCNVRKRIQFAYGVLRVSLAHVLISS